MSEKTKTGLKTTEPLIQWPYTAILLWIAVFALYWFFHVYFVFVVCCFCWGIEGYYTFSPRYRRRGRYEERVAVTWDHNGNEIRTVQPKKLPFEDTLQDYCEDVLKVLYAPYLFVIFLILGSFGIVFIM